jgi:3-oxoacyl-[acyl-carrier protein] reductase
VSSPGQRRVAVVTGGSGGIGGEVAKRLAAEGMSVVVHYGGRPEGAEVTVDEIESAGGEASSFAADVADQWQIDHLFNYAERRYGGLDVVVHTAGIMLLSPLTELSMDDLDRMYQTNIRGTFLVAKQAARRLRRGGALINFSSSVVKIALPGYAAYAATKGAVDAMTPILAKELRGRDVTVNAVAPGPTATPLFLDGKDQATIDDLAGMAPLERIGVPTDIAEIVAFLAGPARWVNGQVIYANGGVI